MSNPDFASGHFWDRRASAWEKRAVGQDISVDAYGLPAINALRVQPGERILDIGCGPGTTAIELAARVGPDGEVVGIDISPAMVEAATRRAGAAGVRNVRFVAADAQTADLGGDFEGAYSRFGVMFFTDPATAFANLGRALKAGGRLAWVVWGPPAVNPWISVPIAVAARVLQLPVTVPDPDAPGPFFLADPARVAGLLDLAGFVEINVEPVTGARLIGAATAGRDVRTLLEEMAPISDAFDAADDRTRQSAVDAVQAAIEPFRDDTGWRLPGAAHLVTAQRR